MDETTKFLREKIASETTRMPSVLIGVSSAAIGFAIHQTSDKALAGPTWMAMVAIALWALSFFYGVRYSENYTASMKLNLGSIEAGRIGYAEGVEKAERDIKTYGDKTTSAYRRQQYALLAGAVAYVVGHIWGMSLN